MKKHILEFETMIPCSAQKLFDFHADTKNLPLITPNDTKVTIIKLEEPLKEGNSVILDIKKHFLSFRWELIFKTVNEPHLIEDVATSSPFKYFAHEHHFIAQDENSSILKDKITFSLPFEPLTSVIAWFIKKDMEKMFAYRHKQTLEYLN